MRKTIVIAVIFLLLSPLIITSCNNKDQELGKIRERVNILISENSRLKKEIAKAKTEESGITFTTFGLGIMAVVSGGLVVWIIKRRKTDGTST